MSELKVYHCNEWHNECTEFYLKSEADKVIARYKYNHCLDMADKCLVLWKKSRDLFRWAEDENLEHYYNHKIEFFARWRKRWLELAKKFKPDSTAQQGKGK